MKENDEIVAKRICPQYRTRYCYNECNWFGNCLDLEAGDNIAEDEAICSTCGRVLKRWVMFSNCTGRNKHYQCPKCYLKGQSESGRFSFGRVQQRKRIKGE